MTTLGPLIYSFFEDYLKVQKGLSPATVKSYRDALLLYLHFVAEDTKHRISRLLLAELTHDRVTRFLKHLEDSRGNGVSTRNQRLAALRTFFEYASSRVPEILIESERVATIPVKRTAPPETHFLERDDIKALFANLPVKGHEALRNRVLLLFLYNTGARVQEVADLHVENLDLGQQPRVRLHGKGDKWRLCPLWEETASLLRSLLAERQSELSPDSLVFVSQKRRAMTRFGIYKVVRRLTGQLLKTKTNGEAILISPHTFRHTTAMHLLESGVEMNVIRSWLGHASLGTTNRYAEISIRMKEKALQACEPPVSVSATYPRKPVWRNDQSLLNWLENL
ncbi:MAG: site-specific integrase [Desulfobulbaceae bacterium]|nr:site-specific integrase [Desulfobulbaceae bacterium]